MPLSFPKFILYSLFRDYFSLALLVPLFPHRQHQENNKQYEICETTSRSDAPYLIISIISLGRHAISQDPIDKVAAAACELWQCVNKSHFSSELYMNSCWSHSEFGELINGRIGLKRLMKEEEKYSAAPGIIAMRNKRNFILVLYDFMDEAKCLSINIWVLLMLKTVWKLQRIN